LGVKSGMKLAIQGELGSFSHQAALKMVPGCTPLPFAVSFQVFEALKRGVADGAVIPIENSLAGPVTEHYDLLLQTPTYIEKEFRLRIVHNLIAAPGLKFRQLRRVISHPVALAQCRGFFRRHPKIAADSFYDTAGAAKYAIAHKLTDTAAIASSLAARQYGGRILQRGLEDNRQNFTRFLLIKKLKGRKLPVPRGAEKTSLAFSLKNRPGTLFKSLEAFATEGINMTKIESRPVPGTPWEYIFYVDLASGPTLALSRALVQLRKQSDFVKILGFYRS